MSGGGHLVEDQREAIAFLIDPRTHSGAAVERIDTHGAVVVLAGDRAYKLKRAVRYPYMDFSTLALRRGACEAELRLNRRTAPALYLEAAPIVRTTSGALAIGGEGAPLDWLVVMRRFDRDAAFDRMAARGALTPALMVALADAILRFHQAAEPRPDQGGSAGIARVIAGNDQGLGEAGPGILDKDAAARLRAESETALARAAPLLEARRACGLVRHCHGDLHLRNICLFEGRPVLFDAIEFNEAIACIDVLYDLAFLLMDLDHAGLGGLGNLVLNRYLSEGARAGLGDLGALAALPLFLSCRAGVRAQVAIAMAGAQPKRAAAGPHEASARAYLDAALRYLRPPPPRLVALGGLSGSGKSTVARMLAPRLGASPGAVVLRSDVIRKRLFGQDALAPLGPNAYGRETTMRVYGAMRAQAGEALGAGHAVIADAVHATPAEREAIEAAARAAGARFDGVWLEAPAGMLEARIAARRDDASDADAAVLRRQLGYELGPIAWRRIDAQGTPEEVAARAAAALGLAGDTVSEAGFGYTPGHG